MLVNPIGDRDMDMSCIQESYKPDFSTFRVGPSMR